MTFVSTDEAAERSSATYRQLDYWVRCRYLSPATSASSGEHRPGKSSYRRWSEKDIAVAAAMAAIISTDPNGAPTELAQLAAQAVYRWHGRAPWVVVALPAVEYAAWSAEEVVALVEGLTVATVVGTAA